MKQETKNTHGGAGRGQGRKPINPSGEHMVAIGATVTPEQRDTFKAIPGGGSAWLRRQLDELKNASS